MFFRLGQKIFGFRIDGNDLSSYSIVLHSASDVRAAPDVPHSVKKSAEILQKYLFALTDLNVPISYDTYPLQTSRKILLGGTLCKNDDTYAKKYAEEEYEAYICNGDLVVNGGKRGILYGVYDFLEKAGLRFFTKNCERVLYRGETIEIDAFHTYFQPCFEYRELCDWNAWDSDFSVKCKLNGTFVRQLRREDGGGVGFAGGFNGLVHTFSHLLPPDRYFSENPDYYALNAQGIRDPSGLCLTNENVFQEVLKNARAWLEKEKDPSLLSVSVNDGDVAYCRCEKCRARLEGGENDTDLLLDFVNRVAAVLAEDYPKLCVDTISYQHVAEMPQKIKPADNVIIRVCSEGPRSLSFPRAEELYAKNGDVRLRPSAAFAERLREYARLCKRIYVWDYPYDYYIVNSVFPVLHTLRENAEYFAKNGVKGVYVNGETDSCEFPELKIYLQAKVLYDPFMSEQTFEEHLCEFLEGYYGKGWKNIRKYIAMCERLSKNTCFTIMAQPQDVIPPRKGEIGGNRTFVERGRKLFAQAARRAETAGERRRIEKSALQVEYYETYTMMENALENADETTRKEWTEKNRRVYQTFVNLCMPRVVENTFLPVVKNFEQPPIEWNYWDPECSVSDRNNETYEREMYLLLPCEYPCGTCVSVRFDYRTNNENERGNIFSAVCVGDQNSVNAQWKEYKRYKTVCLKNCVVTDRYTYSRQSGISETDLRLQIIPMHLRGVLLKIERMDAGAYASVRRIEFEVEKYE